MASSRSSYFCLPTSQKQDYVRVLFQTVILSCFQSRFQIGLPIQFIIDGAKVDMRFGRVRLDLQGFDEARDCLVIFGSALERQAEIVVNVSGVWGNLQRLLVDSNSFGQTAQTGVGGAEKIVNDDRVGILSREDLSSPQQFFEPALLV